MYDRIGQKFKVGLFELNISDGWFCLVGKLMGSSWVVWEILENFRLEWWRITLHIDDLSDSWHVIVEEGKTPDMLVVEFSLSEDTDNFFIEFFIFQHPEDRFRCENISVEYVFGFYELNYLFMVTWAKDVTERFQFIDCMVFFNNDIGFYCWFGDDSRPSACIAGIDRILSFWGSVEISGKLFGSKCVEDDVGNKSVLMTAERDGAFGNIH